MGPGLRAVPAGMFLAFQIGAIIPLHEYGHCAVSWLTGRNGGTCSVHFQPGLWGNAAELGTHTHLFPWEHPLIYGVALLWLAFSGIVAVDFVLGKGAR